MIRHLFIVNPKAGVKSPVGQVTEKIKRAFLLNTHRENEVYDILMTEKKGDATEFARQAVLDNPGLTRIYACGGDGTLNEVVNGIVRAKDVAVCPVPVGSGNDFIRYFDSVPKQLFLDLSACLRGDVIHSDVMRCGDFYALNNISAGLDAYTAKRQQKVKQAPLMTGDFAYKLSLGYSFLSSMKNSIRFLVDGTEVTVGKGNVALAVLGNGKFYGGGFKATPLASIDDGRMDFVAIPTVTRMEFLKYVGDYKKGLHIEKIPIVHFQTCKKIQMLSPKPLVLQADGEIFERENPEIEIIPRGIQLILPKEK